MTSWMRAQCPRAPPPAGRHAAAWSADGSGLEHRLLQQQATERRQQQSPEAAGPEGRAAHGWADRDLGEVRRRQERGTFRCPNGGAQVRQRHRRGLSCAAATAHWRKPPRPCRIREPRSACMVGGVVRARLTLCSVRSRHGVRDECACADASTMPAQMRRCLQS